MAPGRHALRGWSAQRRARRTLADRQAEAEARDRDYIERLARWDATRLRLLLAGRDPDLAGPRPVPPPASQEPPP